MRVIRELGMVHPALVEIVKRIQAQVIEKHKAPFRLFESGREHDRQQVLLSKGLTQTCLSRHLYDLTNDPPLYATAIDYVYFFDRWSWNLRDNTVCSWYTLFGNLVLDTCSELVWGGSNRKYTNYTHFELKKDFVIDNMDKYPCVLNY